MTKSNERTSIGFDINNPDYSIFTMGVFQVLMLSILFAGFFWIWLTDTIDILKRK